uniref:Uncharacterized protein n=1 Tax=Achlya hypogyna TaxID=1202772 RepID=S5UFE3_ACHHY|nr:hypothetical protein P239_p31 [Achlya hypogyna]AGS55468.1 hypothetical protein [Achlya hypogyna]
MQILNKKSILNKTTINYLDTYQYYLKDLNFFNKFKKKNKTLLKDILLLKINDLYLLNINLKENYFFPIINSNNFYKKNKNNLIYFIQNQKKNMINDMVITTEIVNSFFFNFYINFIFKKFNNRKFKITKFIINNSTNNKFKIYYKKKIKINLPFIKSHILKTYKKKYNLIAFCGLIFKIKSKYLYINYIKKKIYNSYLKRRFKIKKRFKIKFKQIQKKSQYFYFNNKLNKNTLIYNFSRISLINDLKNEDKINNFKNLKKINNFKNLKKFSFFK